MTTFLKTLATALMAGAMMTGAAQASYRQFNACSSFAHSMDSMWGLAVNIDTLRPNPKETGAQLWDVAMELHVAPGPPDDEGVVLASNFLTFLRSTPTPSMSTYSMIFNDCMDGVIDFLTNPTPIMKP